MAELGGGVGFTMGKEVMNSDQNDNSYCSEDDEIDD